MSDVADRCRLTPAQQKAWDWLTDEWQDTPRSRARADALVSLWKMGEGPAEMRQTDINQRWGFQWRRRPGARL